MNKLTRIILMIAMVVMALPLQFISQNKADAATSSVPPALCTKTLTGTTSIPKVTLSPKPLDLVFILDASGSFTANMPKVKSMINTAIDKYVQPADGDRTMVTTFQGVKNNIYQAPVGTNYYAYTEGDYKITTNSSKLTSDITSVKSFVNAVTPSGGTPTPSGVTQALNDYKSVAGAATGRQTVFVLITDGVVNVNPKTGNIEKNSTLEQTYIDKFKSVSTVVGTYYDSSLGQYYTQYRWARFNAVTGAFIRYEYVNDYQGTVYDQFYDSANGAWSYIYQYETSQDWKARLNDLTAAVTSVKTSYPNAELVVGFLEDRNSFSNMAQYGPLYETTMRPQIQTTLQSYATDPSYYINTGDPTVFVNQLSAAISNAVQAVSSTGTFTLTAGYKMETMTLVNKTTGQRIPLTFTQNGSTITVNQFDYDGSEYNLEYTTQLLNPDLLVIDADPTADEIGPTLTGELTFGTQKVTVPKFGPSKADTYQYFNCETTVKKSVKKATETSYRTPSTTLDSGTQTFSFSNDYAFNRSPLAWTTSPVLYDKIDPRLEILDVKVIALDKSGTSSVPFTLGSSAITTTNNEVKVTLPADADGTFTSYLGDQYKVLITAKIKPEFTQAGALYTDIVTNGIPNQAEIITTISGTTTKQSLLSNEVKVYAPDQRPWPISFQKNGVAPDGSKKGIPGAEFKITPVTTYEDASGKIVQLENGTPVTATSTSTGKVITPDLMPGVYIVEETTAPPGYVKDNSKYKITINSDGSYTVVKIDTTGTETSMLSPLAVDNKQLKATIDLVKQSNVTSVTKAGDLITYTFTVTNTGEIALYNINLDDPMFPQGITLSKTTLNPGESTTASVTKTVTQQDINAGDIVNTARVTGTPPGDITPPTDEGKVTISTPDTPAITMDKVADKSVVKEGDIVTYNFTVTNTGNVTLTNVSLNDPMLGGEVSLVKTTLLPGESTTGIAKYTVTEKDMFNPTIANTATVVGTPPSGTTVTAKDTETVTPTSTPSITLDKMIQNELVTMPGQTLYYNFTVKNTGDVTLTNVTVSDPMFSDGINLQDTTLSPGETTTGTATHTVTQAEFDSGNIKNTATVTGTPPTGTPPSSTDTVDVPTQLSPLIKLEKTTTATQVKEGDKVTYNFVVTNTGNTTLKEVVLNDPMLGGNVSLQKTTLAPGETTSGTATYTVTTDDMAKDAIKNTATVNGKDSKGTNVTDNDDAIVTPDGKPGINLDKATNTLNVAKAGDVIDYQFTVTNTGDTTLTNVVVTDPMFPDGITLAKTTLAPGESTTGTAKHTVTQAEMNAGTIHNTAKATGTPPSGTPPTSTDEVTVPAIGTTGIDLEKEANLTEIKSAGELVTYTFTVTNTGTTTLKNVVVNDPLVGGPVTIQKTTLEPGETTTGTATYTVQQSDINNGKLPNTAFAVGTAPDNLDDPSDTDSLEIPAVTSNGISIEKTANPTEITAAGQTITYNFKVTNTGNTTLKDVVINDPMFPSNRIVTNTVLEPGESTEGTAIHVVTQEEFDSGKLVNIATVTGTPPSGTPPTDTDTVEVPTKQNTGISIEKTAGQTVIQQTGEVITYSFTVTNTGNTTLTDVVLTDPMFPDGVTLLKTTLLPGESTTGTATHTVTQTDLNTLSVDNTATVTGTPPGDLTPPTATDTVNIPTEHKPEIDLHKHANVQEVDHVGQVITYDLEILNTGNVTLTNIELIDPMFGGVIKLDNTTLQPGEMTEVQLQHVVTQEEFESGEITNTANVTGLPPEGPEVTDEEIEVVNTTPTANITLDKSSDVNNVTEAGDVINYTFVITNTGTSTLTNVTLTDEKLGGSITLEDTVLAPGESTTISKSYTVTQEDINNGEIINTATTTGTPPAGLTPPTATDDNRVEATGTPDIIIVKSVDQQTFKVGDTLTYSFVITNIGNVTLTNVHSEDLFTGQNIELDKTTLEPGEQAVGTIKYVATQEDVDRGRIDNQAVVTGTPPGDLEPPFDNDTVTVTSDRSASISLDKSTDSNNVKLGETITYTFKVKNTGTTTLTDVIVTDPMFPEGITLTNTTLLPGEETTGSATKVVTQADIDRGVITNTATTTGTPPVGLTPPTATDTADVSTNQQSTIDLDKTANKTSVALGDNITYTFTVTNTGNTTLTDVKVTDPMFSSVTLDKTTLAPGETATGTATKEVTQQDVDAGVVTNTATTTATPPSGTPPTDEDTVEVPTDAKTSIKIDKTTDATGLVAGQTITFDFKVTNTGTVSLKDVIVTDPMFSGNITLAKTTLAPGEFTTGTASYVVTQEDVDAGKLSNTAITTGTPPGSLTPPTAQDTVEITQSGSTSISLDKSADLTTIKAGDQVNYTFKITNTGTTTLTNVVVTDPMFPEGIELLSKTLKPGESTTGVAPTAHQVTQSEIDAGKLTNTATATGTPPGSLTPPTATDTVDIPATQSTAIDIEKAALQQEAKVGESITYTFTVTNTGNVTLTNVVVKDPMFNAITLDKATLAPGEVATGTATKVVTQDDIDAGKVTNTATATGTPPGDSKPPTDEDTVVVPAKPETSIALDKSTTSTELVVGENVTFTFKVTNTGNVTLKDVIVTDPMFPGGIVLNSTTLAPGQSTIGTASHKVTQAEVDAGTLINTATTTGTPPGELTPPTAEDTVTITQDRTSTIDLVKKADKVIANVGDPINYTFTVTNTGTTTLTNVVVTDPMFPEGITLLTTTLAPGESTTGVATYIVKQTDVDTGKVVNTATTTGIPPVGLTPPTDTDTATVPTDAKTSITLDKTSDATGLSLGETITYNFKVTNTGTTTLTNVIVTDPMFPDGISLATTTLKPGETTTGTASKVVTQDDIDAGKVENTATTTGTPPGDLEPPTDKDTVVTTQDGTPAITLDKIADKRLVNVGDSITYTFTVTNTGTVTLKDVTVKDAMFPDGIMLASTTLKPGESTTGTATKVVTQDDIDAGKVENTAITTGTPPGDVTPPTDEDTVVVDTDSSTAITLDKSADQTSVKVGDTITYTFDVTNTGTTTLTDVVVTDPMFPDGITLLSTTLKPGESTTGTASKVVTQDDIDGGKVTNTATTTGTPPGTLTPPTATDTVEVPAEQQAAIDLEKNIDQTSVKVGDTITYTFTVTNTGTVTLKDVAVTDAMFPDGITLATTTLKPGETTTGTASKVVTQDDIDGGKVTNTATTTGTPPGEIPPPTDEDTVEVPTNPAASIALDKSTTATGLVAGEAVDYTFTVTNTGNVTLKDVIVTDPMFGGNITLGKTTLLPGESTTGTASHIVTQDEVDAGKLENTALTTGTPPGDLTPPTAEDTVVVTQDGSTAITLDKSADQTSVKVGDTITYTFDVTNTGTTTLTDVVVTDPMFPDGITLLSTTLKPGESTTGTAKL
ncbi:SpaA isopeptide-forming pilin-related protein [Macrococcoides goetzii]